MPVNKPGLKTDLQTIASGSGSSVHDAAQAWADALQAYASAVVPASASVATATSALASALESAFAELSSASDIEAALAAWAGAVGLGMAPAFTATPPPDAVGLAALFDAAYPATHAAAATRMSGALDTWFRTGTGTPSAGGSPVQWS